jgi:hypothetical protein
MGQKKVEIFLAKFRKSSAKQFLEIALFFSNTILAFSTLRFRHQNSHTYGSKPWEFWVKSMALTGRNSQG